MNDARTPREYADRILDRIESEIDLEGKTLYLALDTSYSTPIDADILKGVVLRSFCALRVTRVVAMSFDTKILAQVEITQPDQVDRLQALQILGGGTNPACVLKAVAATKDEKPGLWRRVFIITDGMFPSDDLSDANALTVQPILLIVGPNGEHHRGITCHDL